MRRLPGILLLCLLGAAAGGASAHHSFGAIYDQQQDLALEGTVREFAFIHPHPLLLIDVPDAGGTVQTWRAEMDNRYELEAIGVTARTFRPGDRVRVNGSPGRTQAGILYLWKLVRPADGLRYEQIGQTPYLRVSPSER
jgi:hypothetical protein